MTSAELAQQLINWHDDVDFIARLSQARPQLSLDVVREITDQATRYYLSNPQKSLTLTGIAQHVAQIIALPEAEALAVWKMGGALFYLGRLQEALACFRRATSFYADQGRTDEVIILQVNQIAVLCDLGGYQEAIELAEKTRPFCETLTGSDQRILANLEMNIGTIQRLLGNLDVALNAFSRAYQIYQQLDDEIAMARTEVSQALILEEQSLFSSAITLLHKARNTFIKTEQRQEIARADFNLGVLAYRCGQYQDALRNLEIAQQVFVSLENDGEVAVIKLYRSFVYQDLGLLREAITLAKEAEQVFRRLKAPLDVAISLMNQATGYKQGRQVAQATSLLAKARRILKRLGSQGSLFALDLERVDLALQGNRPQTAQRLAQHLLQQPDLEKFLYVKAKLHLKLAQALLQKPAPSKQQVNQQIYQAREISNTYNLIELSLWIHYTQAILANRFGDIPTARNHLQQAITQVEELKANVWLDELQIGFMDDKLPIYQALVELEHYQTTPTFPFPLVNVLALTHTAHLSASALTPPSDDAHNQILALRQRWHWLQNRLEMPHRSKNIPIPQWAPRHQPLWHQELHQVEEMLAEALRRRRIQQVNSDIKLERVANHPDESPFLVEAIQARLQPYQTFLFYYLASEQCHVLVISPKTCHRISDLASTTFIHRLLKGWQFHVASPSQIQSPHGLLLAQSYLSRLYQIFLQPLSDFIQNNNHLYVVLPTELQNLPLAACYVDGSYLIEKTPITYLAAPAMFISGDVLEQLKGRSALVMGHSQGEQIPYAVQESQRIKNILETQWSTHLATEEMATLATWREFSQGSHLIHLATHATFRPDNPFFSWIRLADGHLTVADIYEMKFPLRPLIVMSACETGRGVAKGGGVLGLARALFAAGASGLILSQWVLEDSATADLMTRFYQKLIENPATNVAVCLQQAQCASIAQNAHPFYWAGLKYLGGN